MSKSQSVDSTIKAVAFYEIIKGLGAITAIVALWIWHSNLLEWLDTANTIWSDRFGVLMQAQVEGLIKLAQQATENWQLFQFLIVIYGVFRFIEAYGLWHDKIWAYWVAILGYGVFIPLEIYSLIVHPFDWFRLIILILNIAVVKVVYTKLKRKGVL